MEDQEERMGEVLAKVQKDAESWIFAKISHVAARWRDCEGDSFDRVLALGRIKGAADMLNPFDALEVHQVVDQILAEMREIPND